MGLLPITKESLSVLNNVIIDKPTTYSYATEGIRTSQRIRAL